MKSEIVFEQHTLNVSKKVEYRVVTLTNRTRPLIGEALTEEQVQKLKQESEDLTIRIKPPTKRR